MDRDRDSLESLGQLYQIEINPIDHTLEQLKIILERLRFCVDCPEIVDNILDCGYHINKTRLKIIREIDFRKKIPEVTKKIQTLHLRSAERGASSYVRRHRSRTPYRRNPEGLRLEIPDRSEAGRACAVEGQRVDQPMEVAGVPAEPERGDHPPYRQLNVPQLPSYRPQTAETARQERSRLSRLPRERDDMECDQSTSGSDSENVRLQIERERQRRAIKRINQRRRSCGTTVMVMRPKKKGEVEPPKERKVAIRIVHHSGPPPMSQEEVIRIMSGAEGQRLNDMIAEYVYTGEVTGNFHLPFPFKTPEPSEPQPGPSGLSKKSFRKSPYPWDRLADPGSDSDSSSYE